MKKGIIYEIYCNITGERYYGSTFKTLEHRMAKHRYQYNPCISRQIIHRGDYNYLNLLEIFVLNKQELLKIEALLIKAGDCINKSVPYRTEEEKKEYRKLYKRREYVKEKRRNKQNISPLVECECGSIVKKYKLNDHKKSKKHQGVRGDFGDK